MHSDRPDYRALLKWIRQELGLSQEDLARQLGVSYATVHRWENERVSPSKLARARLEAFCNRITQEGWLDSTELKQRIEPHAQASGRQGNGKDQVREEHLVRLKKAGEDFEILGAKGEELTVALRLTCEATRGRI